MAKRLTHLRSRTQTLFRLQSRRPAQKHPAGTALVEESARFQIRMGVLVPF